MDAVTWWTAFGAVAQAVGAGATFAAVAVALWQTSSERRLRARVAAGIRLSFSGHGGTTSYHVVFDVLNTGLRPITVTNVGWRVGWLPWGPAALRFQYAIQTQSVPLMGAQPPADIQPSKAGMFITNIAHLKQSRERLADLFARRVPLIGWAPICAQVFISGRGPVTVAVERGLAEFFRTGEHASTLDEEQ